MRNWVSLQLNDANLFVNQLIKYSENWKHFLLLNSNYGKTSENLYTEFNIIAACDSIEEIEVEKHQNFESLRQFHQKKKDWIFGHLCYDLKNETEDLTSNNKENIDFPDLFFFVPRYLIIVYENEIRIGYVKSSFSEHDVQLLIKKITSLDFSFDKNIHINNIKHNYTRAEYLGEIEKIKKHIRRGDVYELNFCTEFFAKNIDLNPYAVYLKLNTISPAPFSAFYKMDTKYALSSSPERFLAKRGSKIISQPIKGTKHRGKTIDEDDDLKNSLELDKKERAENIMIVDLVRNDLSHTAKFGSVVVEELCKIYSYKFVHQMISTISSELDEAKYDIIDVIRMAFPMGSMTGAPKIKAMELIETFERAKRGLFSGSVGYISPEGDFDFNVMIRSIFYDSVQKMLSYSVGSAITHQSIPIKEYKECLLKAEVLNKVFEKNII